MLTPLVASASPLIDNELSILMEEKSDSEFIAVTIGFNNWINTAQLQDEARKFDRIKRREYTINRLKENYENEAGDVLRWLESEEAKGNVTRIKKLWLAHTCAVEIKNELLNELISNPDIFRIRPDKSWLLEDVIDENDFEDQGEITTAEVDELSWALESIGATDLWELGFRGRNTLIAIMDTGCDIDHPDLEDHFWTNPGEIPDNNIDDDENGYIDDIYGWNFYNDNNDADDFHGHGTRSAGCAVGDGSAGDTTGVAPEASLMAIRNYPDLASPESVWIEAFQYATLMGVDVISVSMSFPTSGNPDMVSLRTADANMLAAGVIHANSPGNTRSAGLIPYNVYSPANNPPPFLHPEQTLIGGISACIGVGMYTSAGIVDYRTPLGPAAWEDTSFSEEFQDYPYNDGEFMGLHKLDVLAPSGVTTPTRGGGYRYNWEGTSASTPFVGGSLVLLKSIHQQATPEALAEAILMTTEDGGDAGWDSVYGGGLLRVNLAHEYLDDMFEYGGLSLLVSGSNGSPVTHAKYYLDNGVIVGDIFEGFADNSRIIPGTYDLEIRAEGYDNHLIENINIIATETTHVSLQMRGLEALFTPHEITGEIQQDTPLDIDIQIIGQSTEKEFSITLEPPTSMNWSPEAEITFASTFNEKGTVLLDSSLIVAGIDDIEGNVFRTYNLNNPDSAGYFFASQPEELGPYGACDMASDGEYIYAAYLGKVYKLTTEFAVIDSIDYSATLDTIAGLAIDTRNEFFYMSEKTGDDLVLKGNMDGQVVQVIPFAHLPIGLAYNPDDKNEACLYSLFNDYTGQAKLVRYNPLNNQYLDNFYTDPGRGWGAKSIDAATYSGSALWHVITLQQNTTLKAYHREVNTDVIEIGSTATIPTDGGAVPMVFYPNNFWLDSKAWFHILFHNETDGWTYRLPLDLTVRETTSIDQEKETLPQTMMLYAPYPNPFNPSVKLEYSLPQAGNIELYIVNLLGQRVSTLTQGTREAGRHIQSWNGTNFAAGMYLAVLKSENQTQVKKLLLIK